MANPVCEVLLTEKELAELPKISASAAAESIVDVEAGAIVDFRGVVRALEDGREIAGIEYEAHRAMAAHQLKVIGRRAVEIFGLERVLIHHRIGFVPVAECSLFVRVLSQHRQEAFEASRWIVDELKQKVPIWKRPKSKIDNQPAEKKLFAQPGPLSAK
jgi:molybdopterin synthase catalytic subunit